VDFHILGPLEVTSEGRRLDLGGLRQQIVLAVLLLDAGRVVPIARIMEAIYGQEPPQTSRAQVQICISGLRRLFSGCGFPDAIATRGQGYALQIPGLELDANRFENLLTLARGNRDAGRLDAAIANYRDALALWRGSAFEGIESRLVQSAARSLAEHRITANEDCVQLELDLGRHRELVAELAGLVEEYPLRERLHGQLMLALYRSGRQAEALQAYRSARHTMIEELGIEPNEQLRQLEYAILTADEALAQPPLAAAVEQQQVTIPFVPAMLPRDIADFTGRAKQIDAIRHALTQTPGSRSQYAVPIIVIVGKAGVGKTTIAVHAAHSVAEHFPDGQLFADLHGGTSRGINPMQVLGRFLRVLGLSGAALPDSLDERAEVYRAKLGGRGMLLVLDDAGSEGQVLPLLPGDPSSAVIITSRTRLAGLAGAVHIEIDVFDSDQSLGLLSQIAGADRVQSETDEAAALAALCGHLPLALRIAGARLAARPHWGVGQLLDRLHDETHRLDELEHGDMGIRASISLTYDSVAKDTRRLFRRLAIPDFRIFSAWVGAALLDTSIEEAQDMLDDLADAQLIETVGGGRGMHGQYRFHDLIRVFARERLVAEESSDDRDAALARVLGALLYLAEAISRLERGADVLIHSSAARLPMPDRLVEQLGSAPLAWFERERLNLISGIRQAAEAGLVELCWDLAVTALTLFESRLYLDDWQETHRIALASTRRGTDKRGEAAILHSMGLLDIEQQRFDDARQDIEGSLALFEEVGDDRGMALAVRSLGLLDRLSGRFDEAAAHYERALETFRGTGEQVASAFVLHNMAQLRLEQNDLAGAKLLLSEALALSRSGGGRRVEAQVLYRMGHTYLQADEPVEAGKAFEQALGVVRCIGDPIGEAYALHGLGIARLRRGELSESEGALRHALMLANRSSAVLVETRVLVGLGELALTSDDPPQAVAHLQHALSLIGGMNMPIDEARALIMLSDARLASDDDDGARDALAEALARTEVLDAAMAGRIRKRLDQMDGRPLP
jgi:DNA-binding SARP family transcriptional activator